MKTVFGILILSLAFAVGCSKPQVVGHVVIDVEGKQQVDFGGGTVGGCNFDNAPHEGDDVVISDQKLGTCHALPHKSQ